MAAPRSGTSKPSMIHTPPEAVSLPIWNELLVGIEMVYLRLSPVYWGFGIPPGDGSAVVVIPGFLMTDFYLTEFRSWINRIGYKAYESGIGLNAECPNLLIQQRLRDNIEKALRDTGKKIHLIGHSLGGIIARSVAGQRPHDVASVTTLASPFRGTVVHRAVLNAAESVRKQILRQHGPGVLPTCYTGRCTCDFLASLRRKLPSTVLETAIYTRNDGVVDWRYCMTGDCKNDFEVPGTHIGLAFNASAYTIIAKRLAMA